MEKNLLGMQRDGLKRGKAQTDDIRGQGICFN
jgi:hypothetical protein